jgi:cyclophilin family peptidyl-prolyl cis-trans isomerase
MLRIAFLVSCFSLFVLAGCSTQKPLPTMAPVLPATQTLAAATPTSEMGCSVVSAQPTAAPSGLIPAITTSDVSRGPEKATVTLLAYCDFQSASCEAYARIIDQLLINHPNDLRVVFRPVPAINYIKQLDKTQLSVQAVLAAADQGKFWEMRDRLVAKYSAWSSLPVSQFEAWAVGQATDLGLDGAKFKAAMDSADTAASAKAMYDKASQLSLSIPIAFINGSLQPRAALSYDGLDSTIGLLALATKEFKTCPPFSIDPAKQYTATLHTEKGDIVMQLYADKAPLAVNSFVFLAQQGWFNGVTFHRVLPGFVAQTGDPSGTGSGGPGYYFKNEVSAGLSFDKPGVVGMANSGPDTNGSQFFITYTPQTKLDGSYTIFGQVTQGMDVVESLTARDPETTPGLPPGDKILSVTVQEK